MYAWHFLNFIQSQTCFCHWVFKWLLHRQPWRRQWQMPFHRSTFYIRCQGRLLIIKCWRYALRTSLWLIFVSVDSYTTPWILWLRLMLCCVGVSYHSVLDIFIRVTSSALGPKFSGDMFHYGNLSKPPIKFNRGWFKPGLKFRNKTGHSYM